MRLVFNIVIYLIESAFIALFHEVKLEIYKFEDTVNGCDLLTQGGGCCHWGQSVQCLCLGIHKACRLIGGRICEVLEGISLVAPETLFIWYWVLLEFISDDHFEKDEEEHLHEFDEY